VSSSGRWLRFGILPRRLLGGLRWCRAALSVANLNCVLDGSVGRDAANRNGTTGVAWPCARPFPTIANRRNASGPWHVVGHSADKEVVMSKSLLAAIAAAGLVAGTIAVSAQGTQSPGSGSAPAEKMDRGSAGEERGTPRQEDQKARRQLLSRKARRRLLSGKARRRPLSGKARRRPLSGKARRQRLSRKARKQRLSRKARRQRLSRKARRHLLSRKARRRLLSGKARHRRAEPGALGLSFRRNSGLRSGRQSFSQVMCRAFRVRKSTSTSVSERSFLGQYVS
jgi:hypothetical protein